MFDLVKKLFKKNESNLEEIGKTIAFEIYTASMSLGATFHERDNEIKGDLAHHVNEFIYIFLRYLSRTATIVRGRDASIKIWPCVVDYLVQMLVLDTNLDAREKFIEYYSNEIIASNNYYSERDDLKELENEFLVVIAGKRISKSNDWEEGGWELAMDLNKAGLKTLHLKEKIESINL